MRRGRWPLYVVVLAVMLLGGGLVCAQEKMQIDINTADAATLMTLHYIGKGRAQAIIQHRQEEGRFKTIEDICRAPAVPFFLPTSLGPARVL